MISQAFLTTLTFALVSAQAPGPWHNESKENETVKVDVYYLALCGAAEYFFDKQLGQAVEAIGDYMELNLYPFAFGNGHACADKECLAGHYHACAFNRLKNPRKEVEVASCLFDLIRHNAIRVAQKDSSLYRSIRTPFLPVLCEVLSQNGVYPERCQQDHRPDDYNLEDEEYDDEDYESDKINEKESV